MNKLLKLFFILVITTSTSIFAQSIQANWQCTSAIVEYTHVAREWESPEILQLVRNVTASWPSSAATTSMGYRTP